MTAVSLSDWAAFLSLGVAVHAAFSIFYFLFVEAEPADFDPRPWLRRECEHGRLVPLWQAAVHAGHDLNRVYASSIHSARPVVDYVRLTARDVLHDLFSVSLEATR